ncbi:hypothetical protein GCM10022421_16580 [Oceanisphaera sediminis]|uniref:Uncharacterized protein n=1 Tax=Oceanisphaera sediminis TaxID=981381 RepID=A0ABP7DTJ2_9GAMM
MRLKRRVPTNQFACNQDDNGQWAPARFYDVTFSHHPFAEHATAFCGFGKRPSLKAIQKLATMPGLAAGNRHGKP